MTENVQKYCCKICGFVTETIGEPHCCAKIDALVYNTENEPEPRSNVDALMRRIIKFVESELRTFVTNDPEAEKIHPRLLCSMTATNMILNMFDSLVSDSLLPHVKRHMMIELLHNITEMTMQGFGAILQAEVKRQNMN